MSIGIGSRRDEERDCRGAGASRKVRGGGTPRPPPRPGDPDPCPIRGSPPNPPRPGTPTPDPGTLTPAPPQDAALYPTGSPTLPGPGTPTLALAGWGAGRDPLPCSPAGPPSHHLPSPGDAALRAAAARPQPRDALSDSARLSLGRPEGRAVVEGPAEGTGASAPAPPPRPWRPRDPAPGAPQRAAPAPEGGLPAVQAATDRGAAPSLGDRIRCSPIRKGPGGEDSDSRRGWTGPGSERRVAGGWSGARKSGWH